MQRQSRLIFLNAFVVLIVASIFAACGTASGAPADTTATAPAAGSKGTATSATAVPLTVMSADMSVNPSTVANLKCGTSVTVTYTALFHFPANIEKRDIK